MAFPARLRLRDTPFRYLKNFFTIVQSLSIILDNSETTGREVVAELGFEVTQINYLFDRYRRPVSEALVLWKGTVQDLYGVLQRANQDDQRDALRAFYKDLYENVHEESVETDATEEDWRTILESTKYRISLTWPQMFMRAFYAVFPVNTNNAPDMYRNISDVMNNISIIIWPLTIAQNTLNIITEGRLHNLVTILISMSLWIKLYLMKKPFNELKELMPVGNDSEKIRRADFLYKEVRIALLFVFFFKLTLALLGCALLYAFPQFVLKDLQSQMTQFVLFLFGLELVHNAFYLIKFYRDANIFRVIYDLFPMPM